MHCLSYTHKGAREVRRRCFPRDLGNAPRGPDYLARGCSGRKRLLVLVRGCFCAWILICDPEESSVLLATPTWEHVKFVGVVLHVTLLPVSFVPFKYHTSAPLRVHRYNHSQYSTIYGAITGKVCTLVLFH